MGRSRYRAGKFGDGGISIIATVNRLVEVAYSPELSNRAPAREFAYVEQALRGISSEDSGAAQYLAVP